MLDKKKWVKLPKVKNKKKTTKKKKKRKKRRKKCFYMFLRFYVERA